MFLFVFTAAYIARPCRATEAMGFRCTKFAASTSFADILVSNVPVLLIFCSGRESPD